MLGVTQVQKGSMQHYNSDSIYGLTLAWITSGNSTKQQECRHLGSVFFARPYLLPRLSAVPCRPPLSMSRRQLLWAPFPNQLSFRVPLPLPDTARFQVPKPFVWFRAKTDKGIVCWAGHPHSVTYNPLLPLSFIHNKLQHNLTTIRHYGSQLIRRENKITIKQQAKKTKTFTGSNNQNYKILKGFGRPLKK